jgi:hypothetical protein
MRLFEIFSGKSDHPKNHDNLGQTFKDKSHSGQNFIFKFRHSKPKA